MKNKIISVFLLFGILIAYLIFHFYSLKPAERKILKVVEANEFYVDFNKNDKIDADELVKLKGIMAFTPVKNSYNAAISESIGISTEDFLKLGYLSRKWAKDNFEGKNIKITYDNTEYSRYGPYRFIEGTIDGYNPAEKLLDNGFALLYQKNTNYDYFQHFNYKRIKNNIFLISDLDFLILNSYSGIIHKLDCKYAKLISYGEIILNRDKYLKYPKCKICFDLKEKISSLSNVIPKSKNKYPKSVYKKFDNVELYLINPLEFKHPNNKTEIIKRLVNEIKSAKSSIDIALYGFNFQNEIFDALKLAKARGVKIRVVLDYSKKMAEIYPQTVEFGKEFNAKFDKTETLMHNKFFIFDNKKVITGSANISASGTGGYNSNIVYIINSPKIASYYLEEFNQMYSEKFQKHKHKSEKPPVTLDNGEISVYFSPKDNVYENGILPVLKTAKSEIFISAFFLTHKPLVDELILAKKRGVNVLVLMDSTGAFQFKNIIFELRNNGIPVIVENWGGKNHEKTIMIDSSTLISGSSNFSKSGFEYNDENVLIIKNNAITSFWKDYYLYLFNQIDFKYLVRIPRAESFESVNSCSDGIDNNFDGKIDGDDDGCKK